MRPERPLHTIQENEVFKKQAAQSVRDIFIGENSLFSPGSLRMFESQSKAISIGVEESYSSSDKLNRKDKRSVISKVERDVASFVELQFKPKESKEVKEVKNIAVGWVHHIFHPNNLNVKNWDQMTPAKLSALILNSPRYKELEAYIIANSEPQQVVNIVSTEKINSGADTINTVNASSTQETAKVPAPAVHRYDENEASRMKQNVVSGFDQALRKQADQRNTDTVDINTGNTSSENNVANTSITTTTGEATSIPLDQRHPASSTSVSELPEEPAQNLKERRHFTMPAIRRVALAVAAFAVGVGIYSSVDTMKSAANSVKGLFAAGSNKTEQAVKATPTAVPQPVSPISPVATPAAAKQPESPLAKPTQAIEDNSKYPVVRVESRVGGNYEAFVAAWGPTMDGWVKGIQNSPIVQKFLLGENPTDSMLIKKIQDTGAKTPKELFGKLGFVGYQGEVANISAAEKEGVKVVKMDKDQSISEVLQKFGLFKDVKNWDNPKAFDMMVQIIASNRYNPEYKKHMVDTAYEKNPAFGTFLKVLYSIKGLSDEGFARYISTYAKNAKMDARTLSINTGSETFNDSRVSGGSERVLVVDTSSTKYITSVDADGRVSIVSTNASQK
jgi:hypothetical protein